MADLSLQFDAAPGVDTSALAEKLKAELATIPGVTDSDAQAVESRDPLTASILIMGFIHYAPIVMTDAARIIGALASLLKASNELRNVIVEIRGRKIPLDKLKPEDLATATPAAAPAS